MMFLTLTASCMSAHACRNRFSVCRWNSSGNTCRVCVWREGERETFYIPQTFHSLALMRNTELHKDKRKYIEE